MRHFLRHICPFVCALFSVFLVLGAARAQKLPPALANVKGQSRASASVPVAAQNGPRVALVVACSYSGAQELKTPQNDAALVARALKDQNWDVETVTEPDPARLRAALKRFGGKLTKNSVGLFYFSGKNLSRNGVAYAVPVLPDSVVIGNVQKRRILVNGNPLPDSVSEQTTNAFLALCVSETEIVRAMASAQNRIVVFNGGRPALRATESRYENLFALLPELPPNSLIAYDSEAGKDAYDLPGAEVSPYARRFADGLAQGQTAFLPLFDKLDKQVAADMAQVKQVPKHYANFKSDFVVAAYKSPAPTPVKPPVYVNNNPKPAPPIKPAPIVVTPDPVVPKPIVSNETGQKWALLIGVEKYESDEISALHFTLRDVAALRRTLPLSGFAPEHILAMTSDLPVSSPNYPNNTKILKRISSLKSQLGEDDTLLIYFSGHGFQQQEGGQNYLGSVNADITNATLLKKSTISLEELRESLQGMDASQLILIMDCCRNNPFKNSGKGGADTNARTSSFSRDLSLVSDSVSKKTGTAILFACQEGQRSWEDPEAQQGAFTVFLLEALKGKATRDGTLTVTDLAGYIEKRMRDWCIQNNKDQRPDYEQHNRARIVIQEGPSGAP